MFVVIRKTHKGTHNMLSPEEYAAKALEIFQGNKDDAIAALIENMADRIYGKRYCTRCIQALFKL